MTSRPLGNSIARPVRFAGRVHAAIVWRLDAVRRRLPGATVVYARARALVSRHPLPPGEFEPVVPKDARDRTHLLRRAQTLGPVFSSTAKRQYCVCVTDLAIARRLLAKHEDDLIKLTIDTRSVVPGGFISQMISTSHRSYRKALVRTVLSSDTATCRGTLERIVTEALERYAENAGRHHHAPAALYHSMAEISTGMLLRLFCGAEPGSALFDQLMQGFRALGPTGVIWNIGRSQHEAYERLRAMLRQSLAERPAAGRSATANCIVHRLDAAQALDETMLGTVIYAVEMGRHDLAEFFRWLVRHAGANDNVLDRIAHESEARSADPESNVVANVPLAHAFVLETLRTNQSDRVMRRAVRDFVFEGWLIPRHAVVRVSLWDAHHNDGHFPHPLRFDPSRFLAHAPGAEQFSPFGLDKHACPFAGYSVQLGAIFLSTLARLYTPQLIEDGPAVIGTFYWNPPAKFSASFVPRRKHLST